MAGSVRLTRASSQYLSLADAFDYNAAYTICGWICPRLAVTNNRCVVVVGGDGSNYDQLADIGTGTPAVSISERRNGTLVSSDGSTALVVDMFTFCALVRPSAGGGVLQSYRGDTADTIALDRTADANAGTRALASSIIQLGERIALDAFFIDAEYGGWRAFTRALTLTELKVEAAQPNAASTTNLWADWTLPDASTLTDSSGNGRDLTANNGPLTTGSVPPYIFSGDGALAVAGIAAAGFTGMSIHRRRGKLLGRGRR